MSAATGRSAQSSKASLPAFGAFPSNKAILLERANPGIRRSTPDSDALASSDDEADHRQSQPASNSYGPKPTRRMSWLNEMPSTKKPSMTKSGPYSPNTSHPTTPAGEQTTWGATASPGHGTGSWNTATTSYPWGNSGIWNNENRKDLPSRLQEVLPSPTAIGSPNASFLNEDFHSPSAKRGSVNEIAIPFSIPLHPTPKTYRSQSYSVGQLDPESLMPSTMNKTAGTYGTSRGRRGIHQPILQHRSSRTSGLSELGHDLGPLGRVHEVEDDEEHDDVSDTPRNLSLSQARTIEQLTRENAILRQVATSQTENRYRERNASSTSANSGIPSSATNNFRNARIHSVVPEEADLAVEDLDDVGFPSNNIGRESLGRRYSELSAVDSDHQQVPSVDNRIPDNVKRAHWQTSLGFGGMPEAPQSRRHSFADVPTRHGSISSTGEHSPRITRRYPSTNFEDRDDAYGGYGEAQDPIPIDNREFRISLYRLAEQKLELEHLHDRHFAALYFSSPTSTRRSADLGHTSLHHAYVTPNTYGRNIAIGTDLSPHAQPLYIVTFKCCRSDVFYIQEGTGLQVKPGDLVIVEADRGTDLGTVQHAHISWDEARELKEKYAAEHYNWLMMFSDQRRNGVPNAVNPNGLPGLNGAPGSAVGGMGPPSQHGGQEPQPGELKPKLIKRLAQNHEIQTLRDKEGNEAKAKRVCQQKVAEHRLSMEILDAEFQMDWKKLTFYYFADAYINFNSLVTDLFKIYKTRIWMSAINPASFVTSISTSNLSPFSAPFSGGRDSPAGRRRQPGLGLPAASTAYGELLEAPRGQPTTHGNGVRNLYFNPYQALGTGSQQPGFGLSSYPQHMQSPIDPFASYVANPYHGLDPNARAFMTSHDVAGRGGRSSQSLANNGVGNFSGLSLEP